MWKSILKILEKLACKHQWKVFSRSRTFEYEEDKLPISYDFLLECKSCGKHKKVNY